MCEELEEELDYGKSLARDLAKHLEVMGAAEASITTETNNGCYRITIVKTL